MQKGLVAGGDWAVFSHAAEDGDVFPG